MMVLGNGTCYVLRATEVLGGYHWDLRWSLTPVVTAWQRSQCNQAVQSLPFLCGRHTVLGEASSGHIYSPPCPLVRGSSLGIWRGC